MSRESCTSRQYDVLRLRALGYSQRTIAVRLGISRDTVRDHLIAAARNLSG